LKDEAGADTVASIYEKAGRGEALLAINKVNLLEVYYGFYRDQGKAYADNILSNVKQSVVTVGEFTDDVFAAAGRLKAAYKISLADSIALAEALISGGTLLTADHHEFDAVEGNENIKFLWIR
jgi:predicted nucleic acid-binding protein